MQAVLSLTAACALGGGRDTLKDSDFAGGIDTSTMKGRAFSTSTVISMAFPSNNRPADGRATSGTCLEDCMMPEKKQHSQPARLQSRPFQARLFHRIRGEGRKVSIYSQDRPARYRRFDSSGYQKQ